MSYFDVRIPGLKMTVVAADGQPVQPVPVDEFRIGVAETYDVLVSPEDDRAYTIFAEAMDRSGYARATLAPREGMQAEIPKRRQIADRGMEAMGAHGMGGMDHSNMAGMDHSGMSNMSGMDHSGMSNMSGMDHSSMAGMDPQYVQHARHGSLYYGRHGSEQAKIGANGLLLAGDPARLSLRPGGHQHRPRRTTY